MFQTEKIMTATEATIAIGGHTMLSDKTSTNPMKKPIYPP
jgi:hypothetical protein